MGKLLYNCLRSAGEMTGADPGFLKGGFKFRKGGSFA